MKKAKNMKETGGWKGYPGRFFTLLRKLLMSTGWLVCHFVYFGVIEGCLHANLLFWWRDNAGGEYGG
jgi:hypothetical protein